MSDPEKPILSYLRPGAGAVGRERLAVEELTKIALLATLCIAAGSRIEFQFSDHAVLAGLLLWACVGIGGFATEPPLSAIAEEFRATARRWKRICQALGIISIGFLLPIIPPCHRVCPHGHVFYTRQYAITFARPPGMCWNFIPYRDKWGTLRIGGEWSLASRVSIRFYLSF